MSPGYLLLIYLDVCYVIGNANLCGFVIGFSNLVIKCQNKFCFGIVFGNGVGVFVWCILVLVFGNVFLVLYCVVFGVWD